MEDKKHLEKWKIDEVKRMKLQFPVGQKVTIGNKIFKFTKTYNRKRYKLKLLEGDDKKDLTNCIFTISLKEYKFYKRIKQGEYMARRIK